MTDPEKTIALAGVHLGEDRSVLRAPDAAPDKVLVGGSKVLDRSSLPQLTCQICYDTSTDYSALGCGHGFCNDCYGQFVSHKIADEGCTPAATFAHPAGPDRSSRPLRGVPRQVRVRQRALPG
jgi:ariadne-1